MAILLVWAILQIHCANEGSSLDCDFSASSTCDDDSTDDDTNDDEDSLTPDTNPKAVFLMIHLDPDEDALDSVTYPQTYWSDLEALVSKADEYGHKLTLEFTPQWADYIMLSTDRLTEVRSWETNGHEIAVHHHGTQHVNWDGYTNYDAFSTDLEYLGTMTNLIESVSRLPSSGNLYTGGIGGALSLIVEFPTALIYQTLENDDDTLLFRSPGSNTYNAHTVSIAYHFSYGFGSDPTETEITNAYTSAQDSQFLGFGFHERDYASNTSHYNNLMSFLSTAGIPVRTVKDILETLQ